MAAFKVRIATAIVLIFLLLFVFLYMPPTVTSLLSILVLLYIIAFEYTKLFDVKKPWFWLIVPVYPILPFALITYMCSYYKYRILVFIMIILSASQDSGAWAVGSLFGKHKLAPNISPKKTWEGLFGGYLFTCIMLSIILIYQNAHPSFSFILLFALGVCILATVGDLFESLLKRRAGIKDTGTILPEHGGLLDRFDSFLAVIFLFFFLKDYLIRIFNI